MCSPLRLPVFRAGRWQVRPGRLHPPARGRRAVAPTPELLRNDLDRDGRPVSDRNVSVRRASFHRNNRQLQRQGKRQTKQTNKQTRGSHAGENGARRPGRVTYHPSQELRISGSKLPPSALTPRGWGCCSPVRSPPRPPGSLRGPGS